MSTGEMLYLALVVIAALVFGGTLFWTSRHSG
jgi:hypothetical protein